MIIFIMHTLALAAYASILCATIPRARPKALEPLTAEEAAELRMEMESLADYIRYDANQPSFRRRRG